MPFPSFPYSSLLFPSLHFTSLPCPVHALSHLTASPHRPFSPRLYRAPPRLCLRVHAPIGAISSLVHELRPL
ncbi:hypothetical protein E2C01_002250 [Portunus trituberculatus]|uniref:Uncharacterized protein n=1 Tax=Portunus trituberculatus TaxID=210409 RepID=A0A5B7CQ81_PORTR|nr:hypothetical protein [Portunus trituberculatus]